MRALTAAGEIAAWWAALVGLYVVSISTVGPVELIVAAVASLVAAVAVRRLRLAAGIRPGGGRGLTRAAARTPGAVLHGCATVLAATARPPDRADLRRVPLRPGTDTAWADLLVAASPDTCVLDVTEDGEALIHGIGTDAGPVERAVRAAPPGGRP